MALSVPEVRRLFQALGESQEPQAHRLRWSRFRRRHQKRAQHFPQQRRARQAPAVSLTPPAPVPLRGVPALTDEQGEHLRLVLPPPQAPRGRPALDHRLMVEGMLWVVRTGSSWRALPEHCGSWTTIASRYDRWRNEGRWAQIVQVLLSSAPAFFSSS